jgi:hypothetical protein
MIATPPHIHFLIALNRPASRPSPAQTVCQCDTNRGVVGSQLQSRMGPLSPIPGSWAGRLVSSAPRGIEIVAD